MSQIPIQGGLKQSNPYMEVIEAIEGVLLKLQFGDDCYTNILDKEARNDYIQDLTDVRDTLHRIRQAEIRVYGRN